MKQKFINNITNFITKNKKCDEIQIKKIRYGLEGLYSLITKLLIITFLTIISNTFVEFVLLLIAYTFLRAYSFGLHASKNYICWAITILIYFGGSIFVKYATFNYYVILTIWVFSFINFVLWAPADTPKRPLIRSDIRKKQKFKTCLIAFLYLLIIIFVKLNIIKNAITIALLIQSFMINPISYKFTKTRFNNYKWYTNKV